MKDIHLDSGIAGKFTKHSESKEKSVKKDRRAESRPWRVRAGQVRFSTVPGGLNPGGRQRQADTEDARATDNTAAGTGAQGRTVLEYALDYHSRGWSPVALHPESKRPTQDDFLNVILTKDEIQEHFARNNVNIGIVLGEASGGLVDVDLDIPEAVRLATHFLPETAQFGREHNRGSHLLYVAHGAALTRFYCPGLGMIVEVRGKGGQTVFPGSLYAGKGPEMAYKGEPILWEHDVAPVEMNLADLTVRAGKLAAAAVLLHHWENGVRDNLAVAACGAALYAGWSAEEADDFVAAIAEAAGDESRQWEKGAHLSRKLKQGGRVPGAKKLAEIIGKEKADRVVEWMSLGHVEKEWPDPKPIHVTLQPVPAFNSDMLPEALRGWIMDEAFRMPCSPDFIAAAALSTLGSLIGTQCTIRPKTNDNWLVVPNIWGAAVGDPGTMKTPAISAAAKPQDRLMVLARENHKGAMGAFDVKKVIHDAQDDAITARIKDVTKGKKGAKNESLDDLAAELTQHRRNIPEKPTMRRYQTNDTTVEKLGELLLREPETVS